MNSRYASHIQHLIDAVLDTPGETAPALRRSIEELSMRPNSRASREQNQVPAELMKYVSKVAMNAYKVSDQDVADLRMADYGEDAIFEITLSAVLGAGMIRLERGLAALKGDARATQKN
jgi:hypothetical protein